MWEMEFWVEILVVWEFGTFNFLGGNDGFVKYYLFLFEKRDSLIFEMLRKEG